MNVGDAHRAYRLNHLSIAHHMYFKRSQTTVPSSATSGYPFQILIVHNSHRYSAIDRAITGHMHIAGGI